jgi:hypothetical protein
MFFKRQNSGFQRPNFKNTVQLKYHCLTQATFFQQAILLIIFKYLA